MAGIEHYRTSHLETSKVPTVSESQCGWSHCLTSTQRLRMFLLVHMEGDPPLSPRFSVLPLSQSNSLPLPSRNFFHLTRAEFLRGEHDTVKSFEVHGHKILSTIHQKLNDARISDVNALDSESRYQNDPRMGADGAPTDRLVFYQDLIQWWNHSRGLCMGNGCSEPHLKFSSSCITPNSAAHARGEELNYTGRDKSWSLQRADTGWMHTAINIKGVLCSRCNLLMNENVLRNGDRRRAS